MKLIGNLTLSLMASQMLLKIFLTLSQAPRQFPVKTFLIKLIRLRKMLITAFSRLLTVPAMDAKISPKTEPSTFR